MIKKLRPLVLASLMLPFALPSHAATVNTALPPKVQLALKANKLQDTALSLVMLPLNGPGTPTVFNADVSVNPASTMKLVTTYAALELLGPTFQWKTEFYTDGTLSNGVLNGNLYLKGGGDPKLNMEKLWLLMRDLRANGVRTVTGDLVLDRSHFVQPNLPQFNDDGGDVNKPFLVKPDSLLVNLKALRFVARNDGGKVTVAVEPPIASIRIDNQVKAVASKQCTGDVRYNPVANPTGSAWWSAASWATAATRRPTCRCSITQPTPPAPFGQSGTNWVAPSKAVTGSRTCPRAPACWPEPSRRTWSK